MVGFPNNHWFEPPKNDQYLGCEMGVFPPFKETPIYVIRIVASSRDASQHQDCCTFSSGSL